MTGSGFQKGVEQLKSIQDMYRKSPALEQQAKTSTAISMAMEKANKNSGNINDAMDSAISHIAEYSKTASSRSGGQPVAPDGKPPD